MDLLKGIFAKKQVVDYEEIDNNPDFTLKTILPPEFGLNDLELLETVGTGTFGRVRLCRGIEDNKYYALKMMKKAAIVRNKQLAHIQNEVKILSRIKSDFVVDFHGLFQDDNNIYMVMEYVQGGELFSHLRRKGKFTEEEAKFFICELISSVEYLHKLLIAHRDIRPENLLIKSDGHVCLADFGFAKIVPEQTHTLCGNPEYIAPEVISGKGHGRAVDYWQLGILLYEMLYGHPPFFGENPFVVYQLILKGRVKFSAATIVGVPAKNLIKGLLVIDRKSRLGSGSGGLRSLKTQLFFLGIGWESVSKRLLVPPFIPTVKSDGDASNYDYYPEEAVEEMSNLTKEERAMFREFDVILDRPVSVS